MFNRFLKKKKCKIEKEMVELKDNRQVCDFQHDKQKPFSGVSY